MNEQFPKVRVCVGKSLEDIVTETNELLRDGWQLAGPISGYEAQSGYLFYRELVKFPLPPQQPDMSKTLTERFFEKYAQLDQQYKDLLEINNIILGCDNGRYFTSYKNEVTEGISPVNVLNLLKNSKHCPNDLDEEAFLAAIDGVL